MKESTLSRQSCLLHKPFSSYAQKFAKYEKGLPTTGGPAAKGIVGSQNDIQHFLLTVSQTARGKRTAT